MIRTFLTLALFAIHPGVRGEDSLPDSVRSEFESYVGVWEGTLTYRREATAARWTVAWAPGKQCLIFHEEYRVGGQPSKLTAIMGYDRIKKQVVNLGFRTDGGNRTLTYDDELLSGKRQGDGPEGQIWNSDFNIVKGETEWVFAYKGTSPEAKDFMIRLRKSKR